MSTPSVVLVHGAFADASGWAGVIRELTAAGVPVSAPPTPLRGLGTDAEALTAAVGAVEGPVLLVGHSYGGAVVSQAAADLPNVVGLVYLAAFGLDTGDSLLSVQEPFAPSLLASTGRPSSYPAPGAAGGPDLFVDVAQFRETFCADLPVDVASVMALSQRPLSVAAASEPRSGSSSRAIRSACRPRSAAVPGSEPARLRAAATRARTAVSSPGSALSASWAATSTGDDPQRSSASTPWRCSARSADAGRVSCTASRTRSCW